MWREHSRPRSTAVIPTPGRVSPVSPLRRGGFHLPRLSAVQLLTANKKAPLPRSCFVINLHYQNNDFSATPNPARPQKKKVVPPTQIPAYRRNPLPNKAAKMVAVESKTPALQS